MASIPSHPLIGIDHNNNEHPFEWQGINPVDAATKGCEFFGYTKVLSNHQSQRRGTNGNGLYYRKLLYTAPNGKNLAGKPTISDLMDGPERATSVLSLRMVKDTRALMDMLREQGFVFKLIHDPGERPQMSMDRRKTCVVKGSEYHHIRNLVNDQKNQFIAALQAEAEEQQGAPPKPSGSEEPVAQADPLKGKKNQQEVLLSMLPQMPRPFTADDLIERLRVAGYTELAEHRSRLQAQIHNVIGKGWVTKAGYGKYEVAEDIRHRRPAVQPAKESAPPADETKAAAPDLQPDLPLEALTPPRQVIEVPPPEEEVLPVTATIPAEPAPPPPAVSAQALFATVLDLASQAATGGADTAFLADKLKEACQQLESTMLNAIEEFTSTFNPVIEQLNKQAATRQALMRSLTAVKSDSSK